jgi:YVTN family beta-propeller protein
MPWSEASIFDMRSQNQACAWHPDRGYLVNNMKYLTKFGNRTMQPRRKSLASALLCATAAVVLQVGYAPLLIAQSGGDPISGLVNAAAVALNPSTGKVYTVDTDGNAVDVTDDATGSTVPVKVGAGPVSVAVDTSNGRAYVASAGDGTVSVIDGKTDTVLATLKVGSHPYSIAADSAAGKVYLSRTYSNELTVIDAATDAISGVKTGSPDLIAVNAKTHTVYLLGYEGGDLTVLDGVALTFQKTTVGMHAWGMALNETSGTLYVTRPGYAEVAVLQAGSLTPTRIPTGQIPCSVAVNSNTNQVYVANYADDSITVIDGTTSKAVATIPVGRRPQSVTVDLRFNLVYVANTLGNSVTVIDGGDNRVLATVNAGHAPYALAIHSASGKLHVANEDKTSFTVLDVSRFQKSSR